MRSRSGIRNMVEYLLALAAGTYGFLRFALVDLRLIQSRRRCLLRVLRRSQTRAPPKYQQIRKRIPAQAVRSMEPGSRFPGRK